MPKEDEIISGIAEFSSVFHILRLSLELCKIGFNIIHETSFFTLIIQWVRPSMKRASILNTTANTLNFKVTNFILLILWCVKFKSLIQNKINLPIYIGLVMTSQLRVSHRSDCKRNHYYLNGKI